MSISLGERLHSAWDKEPAPSAAQSPGKVRDGLPVPVFRRQHKQDQPGNCQ